MKCADETLPKQFFAASAEAFQRAEQASGNSITRDYLICGNIIRLQFAGPALFEAITPALSHRAIPIADREPDLTICLWDTVSTGTPLPDTPWSSDAGLPRRRIHGSQTADVFTAYHVNTGILNLLDLEQRVAHYWVRDARQIPWYESGAPLLTILHWWFGARGQQLVHSAAVGRPHHGVLLAGRGGSGKSTTAMACLDAGMAYVSDDYCLVSTQPEPYASSLYCTGKLDSKSLQRLPQFSPFVHNRARLDEEKALFFMQRQFPETIVAGFPLKAVLLPNVTGREQTTWRLATAADGLKALAPSTIFQLTGANQAALRVMADLVRQVPCYHLDLGVNLQRVPAVIDQILERNEP